jgi:adenylylsulfate kinase
VWFTGLPGSGKSAVARAVQAGLRAMGRGAVLLQMDVRRKVYFSHPTYSNEERERAYGLFAAEAAALAAMGKGVLMDGTAPRLSMRRAARDLIPRFAEVHVRCSLTTAMAREAARPDGRVMAGLYAKALERRHTGRAFPGLGQVVGVDVPFEEDPGAELVLDSEELGVEEARDRVLDFLKRWLNWEERASGQDAPR